MTEEQAREELAAVAGPLYVVRAEMTGGVDNPAPVIVETPAQAFWALVRMCGRYGAIADTTTMESLRVRLVDCGLPIFCNGVSVDIEGGE